MLVSIADIAANPQFHTTEAIVEELAKRVLSLQSELDECHTALRKRGLSSTASVNVVASSIITKE